MGGSSDTREDHGSGEPQPTQQQDEADGPHCGHGAASALARFKSQKREGQQGGEPEDAAGGHGQ
jgi:hypothetical protein